MEEGRIRVVLIGLVVVLFAASGAVLLARWLDDEEFPEDIGGICRVVAERFEELQEGPPLTEEAAAARVEELLEVSSGADEALADLSGDAADEEAYAAWLEARGRVSAELQSAQAALGDGDSEAYSQALRAANEGVAERRQLAQAAGLDECARLAGSGA
jgi:hypothetical protein